MYPVSVADDFIIFPVFEFIQSVVNENGGFIAFVIVNGVGGYFLTVYFPTTVDITLFFGDSGKFSDSRSCRHGLRSQIVNYYISEIESYVTCLYGYSVGIARCNKRSLISLPRIVYGHIRFYFVPLLVCRPKMDVRAYSRNGSLIIEFNPVGFARDGSLIAIHGTVRRREIDGYYIAALRNAFCSASRHVAPPAVHRLGYRFPFVQSERQGITFAVCFCRVYVDRDKRRHTKRKHTGKNCE